ncbi:uncharacterized protein [Kogia breviceps]|uniref:uncharacterized protein isoform X2 n=1 Tax=Kogia breviceps TaxID=27615 RepID=UPI0034D1D6AD
MPAGCTAALRTVQSRDPVLLSAQGLSHASLGVSLPPSGAQPRALSRSKWGLSTCQHPAGAEDPDLQGSLACPRGLPGTRHRLQGAPTGPAVDTQLCRTQAAGHAGGKALSRWTHLGRALESTRHRLCTFSAFVSVLCYPAFADLATGPAPGPCPRCPVQPGRGWLALTVGAWQKALASRQQEGLCPSDLRPTSRGGGVPVGTRVLGVSALSVRIPRAQGKALGC